MKHKKIISTILVFLMFQSALISSGLAAESAPNTIEDELNQIEFAHSELVPARTSIYLNLDVHGSFVLDEIELLIDGKPLVTYLYTEQEVRALKAGGIQRIYQGDLGTDAFELAARFRAYDGKAEIKGTQAARITPNQERNNIELSISDSGREKPAIGIRAW